MKTARFNYSRSSGFTLIELLVVIAIIGVLGSIVILAPISGTKKGRDAKRESDIKQYQTALELYASKNSSGLYPSFTTATGKAVSGSNSLCTTLGLNNCPEDPINASNAAYQYFYQSNGDNSGTAVATRYVLWAKREAQTNFFVVCSNGKAGNLTTVSITAGTCPL